VNFNLILKHNCIKIKLFFRVLSSIYKSYLSDKEGKVTPKHAK